MDTNNCSLHLHSQDENSIVLRDVQISMLSFVNIKEFKYYFRIDRWK